MKQQIQALVRNPKVIVGSIVVISLTTGGYAGHQFAKNKLKTYYEDISTKEIAEAKEFYGRLYKSDEENNDPVKVLERLHGSEEEEPEIASYQTIVADGPYSAEEDLIVDSDIIVAQTVTTEKIRPTVSRKRHNIFDDNPNGDFDYDVEVTFRTEDKPYIITHDEFFEGEKDYQQSTLTYFEEDDVLADERDQPVPEDTVGEDHLTRFGFGSKDHNIVYVRNDELQIDFEINRSENSYAKEVLGFDDTDTGLKHMNHGMGVLKFRRYDE